MNDLDKLKEVWKHQDKNSPIKYSYSDIQEMLHKKSSSIVKWIFYISLIEFFFWIFISIVVDTDWEKIKSLVLYNFMNGVNIFNYLIIFSFIILFYKNYRTITVSSNTQKLMKDILKTRKTVYYYVIYNVSMLIILFAIMLYFVFSSTDFLNKLQEAQPNLSINTSMVIVIIISIVIVAVIVCLLLLFYRLIYGVLLKRLKRNYKELSNTN